MKYERQLGKGRIRGNADKIPKKGGCQGNFFPWHLL